MDDDLDQELEALRERILREEYVTLYCFLCGVDCATKTARGKHEALHERTARSRFKCSVCGVHFEQAAQRNCHERELHDFGRPQVATASRKAVLMTRSQLAAVKNLGFGFLRVQTSTNVVDVSTPEDPEASEEEIVARMLERPKRPGVSLNCAVCRLPFDSHTQRGQHERDHAKKPGGWRCSCCGVYERTRDQRAAHELSMHGFQRGSSAEASRRGPSVVPLGVRDDLTRVGANFDEVQEAARQPDESSDEEGAGDIAVD